MPGPGEAVLVTHDLPLPACCPVTGNPRKGSRIVIRYAARGLVLEVASIPLYLGSFVGGKGEIRTMEGMIAQIARDAGGALSCKVTVVADLVLWPDQKMVLEVEG